MKISYNWLSTYFDGGLPSAEHLAELFNAHAFEVEGIESQGNDSVLEVKVLPDRAHYALSHRGIAYEAAAISGASLKQREIAVVAADPAVGAVMVRVEEGKGCPRYMARRVEGVTIGESPVWLKERLEAIGARSINCIVDATNYVMFDVGQPLHAFDADKVRGGIVVRKALAGEKIVVLDGRQVELKESDLVIADEEGPLAIAGVKGGKKAEVTASTKSIILESANFNPVAVRRTSTHANLRNDSSKRFENEITPALAEGALNEVTALIQKLSSGARAGGITDVYPIPASSSVIRVDAAHVNSVTGLSLSKDEIVNILLKLRCTVTVEGETLTITPPLERLDLKIPEDIADEVARMYGYDRLEAKPLPDVPLAPLDKTFFWSEKVKTVLVSLGFSETLLYTLVSKGTYEVTYPLASDKSALRERISPKLVDSLAVNARNAEFLGLETVRVFEIGKIFPQQGEKTSIAIGVCQVKKKKGVTSESVLKGALAAIENILGVPLDVKIEVGQYGAVAEADFDAIVARLGAAGSITDLAFTPLPKDKKYKPFSPYPFMVRDIALFVPVSVTEEDVKSVISSALAASAGALLVKGPDCFDRFEKDGRHSFAFRSVFQSFEKTLSDEEVNAYMTTAYDAVKNRGWEVR